MNEELKLVLRNAGEFIYIPNIGNAGDALIAHSTYSLFEELELSYHVGDNAKTYPDQTVVYGGGGAFVQPYGHMTEFLQRNLNQWRQLIVLPHTMLSYAELLAQFNSNTHLFCRETASFDFARANASNAEVYLGHDMAFGCNFTDVECSFSLSTARGIKNHFAAPRRALRLHRRLREDLRRVSKRGDARVLNAFRADVEQTDIKIPEGNVDLSESFADDSMMPLVALYTTYRMMRFLKEFKIVRTNRLHVSIMSALLGLEVDLYDNSYGKNRAVFEHSMRTQYKNVRWCQA